MQLLALNPTTNITRVSNVPALNLTLTGAAPETTVITATISNVPALSIVLTPPAPTTNITRVSDGVAAAIALNALAPETTHIVPGLTTSDVPALNLSLNALAPSSLRELISEVPVKDFVITGRAPTTSDPTAVAAATTATGGWIRHASEETEQERRARVQRDREQLGIVPKKAPTPPPQKVEDKKIITLAKAKKDQILSELERDRLINELEAMAQADEQQRRRSAMLLLLL